MSVNLPDELAERFDVIEEIGDGGREGNVLVVDDHSAGGERRVLKLYRRGIVLREDALETLMALSQREGKPHIVTLHEVATAEGLWYEVQEHCALGSLRQLLDDRTDGRAELDPHRVATEIGEALAFLEKRLFLCDVKPENLLVRTLEPLDLVVADFGLALNADAGSMRWAEGGTVEYMPPEATLNEVTAAWDWWSAGMVVAEVALGRHPLADEDGVLPPLVQVPSIVNSGPVDVSDVADERLRLLSRGLLVRDPKQRWRAEQVRTWLAGGTPDVPDDTPVATAATGVATPAPPTSRFGFGGRNHDDPRALAAAFQQQWDSAMAQLFQDRDPAWIAALESFLRDHQREGAASLIARQPPGPGDLPARMATLLLEMDPVLDPVFDGLRLTPGGLAEAADDVIAGNRSGLQSQLRQVRESGILRLWRTLPDVSRDGLDAGTVDTTWRQECARLDELVTGLDPAATRPPADVLEVAKARLLLCALDPRQRGRLRRSVGRRRRWGPERRVVWWQRLADEGRRSVPAAALATLLAPDARYAAERQRQGQGLGDTATGGDRAGRQRGTLTPEAIGPWLQPAMIVGGPLVLGLLLWAIVHFELPIEWFMGWTTEAGERTWLLRPEEVARFLDLQRWIIALAPLFVVAQLTGRWLRERRVGSVPARLHVVASALVQVAISAAVVALAALGTLLGYIAFAYEDEGLPAGFVPDGCKWLVVAPVAGLVAAYGLVVGVRRLALGLLGGQVVRP